MAKIKKIAIILILLVIMFQVSASNISYAINNISNTNEEIKENKENEYYYLSDLNYITENRWSYAGYGELMKDKNTNGGTISLLIDGTRVYYNKGLGAHASSLITYDISQYSNTYTRLVAKLGIDSAQSGKGNVWFRITVSNDGTEWKEIYKSESITSADNAIEVDLDIENYKYLRLWADKNGGDANDHAVYADARIVKKDFDISSELYQGLQKISYYDEIISNETLDNNYEKNFDLVLKREFVNRIGYWTIQNAIKYDESGEMKETIDWLLNDENALQLL